MSTSGTVRERETLLKLFIGLAAEQYGFKSARVRSPAAGQIASDLANAGLAVDEDTVRKFLKLGAELLPPTEGD
ncbi:hypothetical protein ATO4_20479 [Aurantimonas sp. 22II-16-19i]|nr:hypothetical protein ATO4_20479 [Aurantimonas sp. 22II-16-19i]